MSHETVLTVFVAIAALAFLVQAGLMLGVYLSIRDLPGKIEAIRADVKQRLDPLTQNVTEIVANSREPVRTIATNLAEISQIVRDRTNQVDGVVADLVDRTRLQIIRVDQMASELVQKVESTTEAVQHQVLVPIQEISAVVKGVRAGLEFLFSKRRVSSVSEATQDEQLFI